jgi:hypothetical protein
MKRLLSLLALLFCIQVYSQTYKLYETQNIHNQLKLNTKTGEVYQVQDDGQTFLVTEAKTPDNDKENKYTLQKTENIWTFIMLDQFSGKLWQCQFSVKGAEYRGSWEINPNELSLSQAKKFSIQPLTSMYQFYLINDDTGELWKFQWGTKGAEYRWIKKQ